MARNIFRPAAAASGSIVRFDTASGSDTPADIQTLNGTSIEGSRLRAHSSSGALPPFLGPDGVSTLYAKALDYQGAATGGSTTLTGTAATPAYDPSSAFAPLGADSPYPRVGPGAWALGDSITANGISTTNPPAFESRAWYVVASMALEGRLRVDGVAATSGYTTAQILATHLPTVVAARPAMCFVLAGRNDVVNGVAWATTKANLQAIYGALLAAGTMPILLTLTANSGNTSAQNLLTDQINGFIRAYASAHRLPLVDIATYTNTTAGAQVSGWFADASHPNAVGAKNIGTYVATVLSPWLAPHVPQLALWNSTPTDSYNLVTTPLMLVDTNSDGVPDNYTNVPGTATGTSALVAGTGNVRGSYNTVSRTGGTGVYYNKMAASAAVTAGHRMALSARIKATVEAGSATAFLRAVNAANSTVYAGIDGWAADIAEPTLFYTEFVVPAGVTNINLWWGLASGTGSISVAQLSLRDLTTMDSL